MSESPIITALAPKTVCAIVEGPKGKDFARELREAWNMCPTPPALRIRHLAGDPQCNDAGEVADVALIATSAEGAARALACCPAPVALVSSSGFGESGREGRDHQARLCAVAKHKGIRLLGPNCGGAFNVAKGLVLSHQPVLRDIVRGPLGSLAVIAQGGSALATIAGHCLGAGLPLAYGLSTGNEADVDSAELLRAAARDPDIRGVLWVLEGMGDPRSLSAALTEAERTQTLVCALPLAITASGRRASLSHTGQIATKATTIRAVFERHGVLQAESFRDLVHFGEVCAAFEDKPRPRVRAHLAVLATSGAHATLLADTAQRLGVPLASLRPSNPLDVGPATKDAPEEQLTALLAEVESDPDVGATLFACTPSIRRDGYLRAISSPASVPRLICGPEHGSLVPTLKAVSQWLRPLHRSPPPPATEIMPRVSLDALTLAPERIVHTADDAVSAAQALGGAVVLKLANENLPHKTPSSGVLQGLDSPSRVRLGFEFLLSLEAYDAAGVRVQATVEGLELFVGTYWAEGFGAVVLVGNRGSALLGPLTSERAARALEEEFVRSGELASPAMVHHGAQALVTIAAFAQGHGHALLSADFNPLILNEEGAWVVDHWLEWSVPAAGAGQGAA